MARGTLAPTPRNLKNARRSSDREIMGDGHYKSRATDRSRRARRASRRDEPVALTVERSAQPVVRVDMTRRARDTPADREDPNSM
jgi:hypothetical protein